MDFWIILFLSKHANITQDKEWDVCESTTIGMSQTFISVLPVSLMKKKFYTSAIPSRSIFPFKSTCRFGFWGYRMKNLLYIVAEVYNKRENNGTKKEKKGWSSYLSFLGLSFLMHMLLLGL